MKKTDFILSVLMLMMLLFASCGGDDEQQTEVEQPDDSLIEWIGYDDVVWNVTYGQGNTPGLEDFVKNNGLFVADIELDELLTVPGYEPEKIECFWDKQLVGQASGGNYRLSYRLENQKVGAHSFQVKFTIKAANNKRYSQQRSYVIYVIEQEPQVNLIVGHPYEVRNDEKFDCYISLDTSLPLKIPGIECYVDGKYLGGVTIDASAQAPYPLYITLRQQSKGEHEIKLATFASGKIIGDKNSQARLEYKFKVNVVE